MYEDKDCILILGCSLSGKTTLSRTYTSTHKIIHTDDCMNFGDYKSVMFLIAEIVKTERKKGKIIIEGVQGYRLLRHWLRNNYKLPDVVIELDIDNNTIKDRSIKLKRDYKGIMAQKIGNDKIMKECKEFPIFNNVIYKKTDSLKKELSANHNQKS